MEQKNILLTTIIIVGFIFMISCLYCSLPIKLTDYSSSYWIPMIIFMLVISELVYFNFIYDDSLDNEQLVIIKICSIGLVFICWFMFSALGILLHKYNIITLISVLKWTGIGVVILSLIIGFFWLNIYFGKKVMGD